MLHTTLLRHDGTIVWTSHSPGPPIEKLPGTKIWIWAHPRDRDQWRALLSAAVQEGHCGPHPTEYHGDKYIVELLSLPQEGLVVAAWRPDFPAVLSEQETKILALIATDVPPREIAKSLRLSVNTVETYRWRIRKKLGASGTAGLAKLALRTGLIKP